MPRLHLAEPMSAGRAGQAHAGRRPSACRAGTATNPRPPNAVERHERHYRAPSSTIEHYRVLSSTIEYYRVLSSTIEHYRALSEIILVRIPLLPGVYNCVTALSLFLFPFLSLLVL